MISAYFSHRRNVIGHRRSGHQDFIVHGRRFSETGPGKSCCFLSHGNQQDMEDFPREKVGIYHDLPREMLIYVTNVGFH